MELLIREIGQYPVDVLFNLFMGDRIHPAKHIQYVFRQVPYPALLSERVKNVSQDTFFHFAIELYEGWRVVLP